MRLLVSSEKVGTRNLQPKPGGVSQLQQLAALLSGQRVVSGGGLGRVPSPELHRWWKELRPQYPQGLPRGDGKIFAWIYQRLLHAGQQGDEEGLAADLGRFFRAHPSAYEFDFRAQCEVRLGRWADAAQDFSAAQRLGVNDPFHWYRLVLCQLAAGNLAGYRASLAQMERRFNNLEDSRGSTLFTETATLTPGALQSYREAIALAEQRATNAADRATWLGYAAALRYRAGDDTGALAELERGRAASGDPSEPLSMLFLAMAHHRLGHRAEARAWIQRATTLLDQESRLGGRVDGLDWQGKIEVRTLRAEAERVVGR